jgi:CelD/BcsL family acetyltransferase involved in cellulose biosynthesis
MTESGSLKVERISSFDRFLSLESEWNAVENGSAKTIFLMHFWLSQWWKNYSDTYELWTLTVRDDKRLIGILPLVRRRSALGSRLLTIMGTGEITPNHLDIIAIPERRDEVMEAVADYLRGTSSEWDMLELDKITEEGTTKETLGDHFSAQGFIVNNKVSAKCSYIMLPASFDEYLKSRSHNMRRRLHKAKRNLNRDFPQAGFKPVQTEAELDAVMSALSICIKNAGRKRDIRVRFQTITSSAFIEQLPCAHCRADCCVPIM